MTLKSLLKNILFILVLTLLAPIAAQATTTTWDPSHNNYNNAGAWSLTSDHLTATSPDTGPTQSTTASANIVGLWGTTAIPTNAKTYFEIEVDAVSLTAANTSPFYFLQSAFGVGVGSYSSSYGSNANQKHDGGGDPSSSEYIVYQYNQVVVNNGWWVGDPEDDADAGSNGNYNPGSNGVNAAPSLWHPHDVIGIAVDRVNNLVTFYYNGASTVTSSWDRTFENPNGSGLYPQTITNTYHITGIGTKTIYPVAATWWLKSPTATINGGTAGFAEAVPFNYGALDGPLAPTGLTATPGSTQVTLNWTASSGATSYSVYRGTSAGNESTTAVVSGLSTTSYTNTGLTNGTTYYYEVKAVNSGGASGTSNEASTTPTSGAPPTPTGLVATPGNAQVALAWTASSGATGYNVQRATTSNGTYTTVSTNQSTTTFTNTGLTNGTTYYYEVNAQNGSGTSANTSPVSATPSSGAPSAPTGVTATPGSNQVTLAWTASSGATSYNVYRSTSSGGPFTTAYATGISASPYTDMGAHYPSTFYYEVSATNSSGTSANSTPAVSAVPTAPVMLGAPIRFTSAADLQNNFWSGATVTDATWDSAGNDVTVTFNGNNSAWIYNPHSTGGTGGHPGTAGGTPLSNYSNVILRADVSFDALANEVDSFGFYTNINSTSNGAMVVLVCPQNSTSFDVRIGGVATPIVTNGSSSSPAPNPSTVSFGSGFWLNSATGTGPITTLIGSNTFSTGTPYTVEVVEIQNTAAFTITYQVNIYTTSGTLMGSYSPATITGVDPAYSQPGQVGVFTRDKSTTGTTHITNFAILPGTVIPFDAATDLQNNFWSGATVSDATWDPNGYVDVTYNGNNSAWIYNTGSTGGASGHPGTAGGSTLSNYSSVTLQAEVEFDALSNETDSFGFYTNINSTSNGAFCVLICPQNSTSFDARIGGVATPTVGGGSSSSPAPNPSTVTFGSGFWLNSATGTGPITTLTGSNTFSTGVFYPVQLVETQNATAQTIDYQLNVFTTTGTLMGSYDSGVITNVGSGYNQAGQIGIFTRDKSTTGTTHIQNLFITPSP